MISRSTEWDDFVLKILEYLGADPKQVVAGSAVLEASGENSFIRFTCSFMIPPTALSQIQSQHKQETA